jgi:hypothetical protein
LLGPFDGAQLNLMAKRPKPRPPRWRAYLMHGKRAEYLGEVGAGTETEAHAEACREFGITADWQRRRVIVRREAD